MFGGWVGGNCTEVWEILSKANVFRWRVLMLSDAGVGMRRNHWCQLWKKKNVWTVCAVCFAWGEGGGAFWVCETPFQGYCFFFPSCFSVSLVISQHFFFWYKENRWINLVIWLRILCFYAQMTWRPVWGGDRQIWNGCSCAQSFFHEL